MLPSPKFYHIPKVAPAKRFRKKVKFLRDRSSLDFIVGSGNLRLCSCSRRNVGIRLKGSHSIGPTLSRIDSEISLAQTSVRIIFPPPKPKSVDLFGSGSERDILSKEASFSLPRKESMP